MRRGFGTRVIFWQTARFRHIEVVRGTYNATQHDDGCPPTSKWTGWDDFCMGTRKLAASPVDQGDPVEALEAKARGLKALSPPTTAAGN